jgi:hypothetical protein
MDGRKLSKVKASWLERVQRENERERKRETERENGRNRDAKGRVMIERQGRRGKGDPKEKRNTVRLY